MMKKWLTLLTTIQIVFIIHAKDLTHIDVIYRVRDSQREGSGTYLVDKEIHLRNNALGKSLLFENGTFLVQYSLSSFPSFECLYQNETCLWTKTGDWSISQVTEEQLDSFILHMPELQQPCQNNNGGCQVYCHNEPNGPECSCALPGFSLNSDNKTCAPYSENFFLLVANEGSFTSKGYPNHYKNGQQYHWLIVAPQGRRIHLNISELKTEDVYDTVTIYDYSHKWSKIKMWSGQKNNLLAESTRNLMWIAFRTDYFATDKGFQAFYTTEGHTYNTLLMNSNNASLSTTLNSYPSQLCVSVTYKLAPSGAIDLVIKQEGENDKRFTISHTRESNGWSVTRFLSPILPDDTEEKMSLFIHLAGEKSQIFHVAECKPNDEADVYITNQETWKSDDFFEPGVLKQDETGNCQNGGTFLQTLGVCDCPAGFGGTSCQEACGPNRYGNCSQECSCFEEGCKNMMFCKYTDHRSSCICASGYRGKACSKECNPGYYGVNCESKCGQCRDGPCNIYTGKCIDECIDGYYPPLCQERYVTLMEAPKVEEIGWNSAIISTNLSQYEGRGTPYLYQVQYKEKDGKFWSDTQAEEMRNVARKNITGLQAGIYYLFRVILISDDGNRYQGPLVPAVELETSCEVPDSEHYQIVAKNLNSSGFLLEWNNAVLSNKWCPIISYNVILQGHWIKDSQNISSGGNLFVVYSNLLPAHHYEVFICAVTRKGKSCSSPFPIATKEKEPGHVIHLNAVPVQGGKIQVSWNKPSIMEGNITGYKLRFQCLQHLLCGEPCSSSEGELNVMETQVELNNLLPLAQYKIRVAAVTMTEGPYTHVYTATKSETPKIPPRASMQPIVSKSNISATVQWTAPICVGLNGELRGYHYILMAETEDGSENIFKEGTTQDSQITFSSLIPRTNYKAYVYALNSQGWNADHNLTISFITAGTVPDAVEGLEIFKKGRRIVGIRWASPRRTYGEIKSFTITHHEQNTENDLHETIDPTPCLGWPHLYCHTIARLRPEKNYSIEVRARNNEIDEDGPAAHIIARTNEDAPEAPTYLKVLKSTSTSFDIEWGLPKKFNGELRAFIVNVEHQDSLNEEDCCEYFPVQELPFREEQPAYYLQVSGLTPASRFIISVTGKTITMGPNANATHYTAPFPPTNLVPPKVFNTTDDGFVYSVKVQPVEINSKINGQYMVLVLPSNNTSMTNIWDEDLSDKLRSEVNESFYIVSEFRKDELVEEQEVKIGTGIDALNGTLGIVQNPKLTPGIYRIGLALVLNYNGAKSVGFVTSEPFHVPKSEL